MASAQPVTRRDLRRATPRLDQVASAGPLVAPVPTTRRELREAARNGGPLRAGRLFVRVRPAGRRRVARSTAGTPGRHVPPTTSGGAHRASAPPAAARYRARLRSWAPPPDKAPLVGLLVAVAFLAGGITSVQSANATRADRAAMVAATQEAARQTRVWAASEARLTGLVTAEAAHHRTVALDAAAQALAAADATLADAGEGVAPEMRDSLAAAATRLAALVELAPAPAAVLGTADEPDAVVTSPVTDGAVTDGAVTDGAVSDGAVTVVAAPGGTTASPSPAATAAEAEPVEQADPGGDIRAGASTADVPDAGAARAPIGSTDTTTLKALDAQTSDQLLEIAEEVTNLVEQVRLATERAEAAQLAAAQVAEAARVAAEQAAAREVQDKIAAADAAPNGDIPRSLLCGVAFDPDVLLRCDAAADLERLNAAFRDHFGSDMSISDSYRDYDGQVLARQNRGDLAATPGTSNHGRGLAIDLNGYGEVGQFDRPYFVWMSDHAADYGWLHPSYMGPGGSGPLEPWHWEYRTQ